ncbi:putative late blight resistance protein homolog R1A-10 [Salvia hispanica]|uniref:putative late blight resistance protein homolog R1A-10 n=1 Tax=Salvia hispanica TaxID=49212 RepID=UPI002009B623|nr:putative late blight resistance protein homolog R1A-10 [Salvia hispanica]XP_047982300.1 putative late blight resistance protein homolog R1A-10 [Salvia hispanica]
MGGIGKTTLTKKLFVNALVKEDFHIRAWTTISQTYNVREILREVLLQASGESSDLSENDLGNKLYKYLSGRRYLVIMDDDMWSIEVWDRIKFFFPDYQNRSRIIVTTRLSNLGSQLNESYTVDMQFLDEVNSWGLFCKIVFGKERCPLDLEDIGRNIVANCKGLPLTIATIGGLLSKFKCTREFWKCIGKNLKSIVTNSSDGFCLKILRMSYICLPNYLKPCFSYMGIFEEDHNIRVSMLEKLWVSEGFLKPRSGKCLETIAKECFNELVDRNLVLVDELGLSGNVKYCKIHDLLRDLCLKEVERERFHHVIRDSPLTINTERRVVFSVKSERLLTTEVLGSLSHARSILLFVHCLYQIPPEVRLPHNLRLLRTFKVYDEVTSSGSYILDNVFELVNSRYLAVRVHDKSKFPSSIDKLWNLHTLIIHSREHLDAPSEIWKLHQLRYLESHQLILPNPPSSNSGIVIKGVLNLFLNEEVVKRIPNVTKLHLEYDVEERKKENSLSHLECLSKLENFHCSTSYGCDFYLQRISFPHSLKKLYVSGSIGLELEGLMPNIGSLPLLEKLVLKAGSFCSGKWETTEEASSMPFKPT